MPLGNLTEKMCQDVASYRGCSLKEAENLILERARGLSSKGGPVMIVTYEDVADMVIGDAFFKRTPAQ